MSAISGKRYRSDFNRLYEWISRALRKRLLSRLLARHGVAVLALTRNGTLVVDPWDCSVSRALLKRGSHDLPEVSLLARLLTRASRVVFAGAHIGSRLVPIVRTSGCRSVVAFEPSPRSYRLLELNLRLNEIRGVMLEQAAVGDRAGTVLFIEDRINTDHGDVSRESTVIEVPLRTLDATLPASWNAIDLVVMDVHGFEVHALRGAAKTLAKTRYLFVEFAPERLADQGSAVEEFVELVASHFSSVYVIDDTARYVPPASYPAFVTGLMAAGRGQRQSLLFSRDSRADPAITAEASGG